jgi:exopolyphosphatase/guanosine-5'-triphosphate,3'-diphosphate pyrophosphatase
MSPTSYQTAPPRVAAYVLAKIAPRSSLCRVSFAWRAASTIPPVRVAVIDIGTNSTRLLIAEVDADSGTLEELVRRSQVTRLGDGVDASGSLSEAAIERVLTTLAQYREEIDEHDCEANLAVLTSAVRDAANGASFAARVRDQYGLDARILAGEEEAQLTFLGAMSTRPLDEDVAGSEPTVVIDIGGGSTEFIVGEGRTAGFHVSLPVGVVRMSERHIHSDPPAPAELQELADDVRAIFLDGLPAPERAAVKRAIAVAGTATSAASIDQQLEPYDPARVQGYQLLLGTVEMLLARLADMDEDRRREVVGLHPDRAPTIVAGMIVLAEALRAFQLDQVEVSEHDILYGGALRLAGLA